MESEYPRAQRRGGKTATAALLEPGGPLNDRYEVGPVLGRGGMSEVRDGWDLKLDRPVAIKVLHAGGRPENRLRFATEARAAANLSGQHIVVVYDVGEHQGMPFIVMERLPGVTLADHIARGPLQPAFVQDVLDDVLAALALAHDAGIVHRDVKPGNVLFTATGEAKLADFGIAKLDGGVHTRTGEIVGSMAYLSPERLTSKPATPADDLYAVGVLAYEALTGRRPFPQTSLGELARAILNDKPLPVADVRPGVPAGLSTAIERSLSRNPDKRFTRADAMRAALVDSEPATVPVHAPTPIRREPIRHPSRHEPSRQGPSRHEPGRQEPIPQEPTRQEPVIPAPVMQTPRLPPLSTHPIPVAEPEEAVPRGKLWVAAIIAVFLLAIMLIAVNQPFSSPPPSPASTSTPLPPPPPPTATIGPSEATISNAPAPPPAPPPWRKGKKPKGGKGD
jgi:serine/threonine-protein kinase